MAYDNYSPTEQDSIAQYDRKREEMNKQLADMIAKRQAAGSQYGRMMGEFARKQERENATDWMSTAGKGAMIGGMFGPQGAAYGAGAGALLGIGNAVGQRMSEGAPLFSDWKHGFLGGDSALGRTLGDMSPLTTGHAYQNLLPAAAMVGSQQLGNAQRNSTTADPFGWGSAEDQGWSDWSYESPTSRTRGWGGNSY